MHLPTLPHDALVRRREALMAALGNQPALLVAGLPRARNYAANAYPFRAHSHFLYFFGWATPGAVALFDDGRVTLYLPPGGPDDALWSGPTATPSEIGAALKVNVAPLSTLDGSVAGRDIATLPAADADSRAQQASLLRRSITAGTLTAIDALFADAVIGLRLRHDDAAVAELRLAAEATAHAHRAGMRVTVPGIRESVVRAAMEAELTSRGCATAYGSIVTVHGEILHNETHQNVLEDGDLLLADVGAETPGGWAGDVTRTWPVSRRYTSQQAEIYDVVMEAQRQAIAAVRPGARYRDIHLRAAHALASGLCDLGVLRGAPADRVEDGTAALLFPHGVGHLLGLDVHDMEDLGDRAGYAPGRQRSQEPGLRYLRLDRDLVAGMAVTIEPGIYFVPALLDDPEVRHRSSGRIDWTRLESYRRIRGIRIEDDILVTPTGAEVLTAAIPKTRNEIEEARRN
ncbi:MAG: aminopeptidase P family protein [Deltaproteobacteria bacterium]|nr:aminopeptidase P family protein [Deltaproteobacteria bacterium]